MVGDLDAAANGQANTAPAPANMAPNGSMIPQEQPVPGDGSTSPWWLLIPVGAVGGVALWAGSRAGKKRREMQEALAPVNRLRGEVVNGISYADTYLDLLPDSSEATAAR